MKLILKLAALILALGSVACLILANMERISDWMACLRLDGLPLGQGPGQKGAHLPHLPLRG